MNLCEVPFIFMELCHSSQCTECFFMALQTPSSCVMNDGAKFHLTLQQFPSALIVLGKQQSLQTVTEIVPSFISRHNKLYYGNNAGAFLSSLSRTMKLFEVFLEMCTDECTECYVREVSSCLTTAEIFTYMSNIKQMWCRFRATVHLPSLS